MNARTENTEGCVHPIARAAHAEEGSSRSPGPHKGIVLASAQAKGSGVFRCCDNMHADFVYVMRQAAHIPLPEPRMLGNAEPEAQASGNEPLILLLLSARMASLGSALFWPHDGGSVPLI